jgi:hypothetical protein
MEENIIGGVSPVKQKKMARGKSYGKGGRGVGDTRYKRDKWQKPTSGGTTTLKPKRSIGELPPNPRKPYTIKDGKVVPNVVNNYNYNNSITQSGGGSETITTTTPDTEDVYENKEVKTVKPYSKEWDVEKAGGLTYAEWIAKPENKEKEKKFVEGQTKTTLERVLVSKGKKGSTTTTTKKTDPNNIATINNNPIYMKSGLKMIDESGKYKLGGYRAMRKNSKKKLN